MATRRTDPDTSRRADNTPQAANRRRVRRTIVEVLREEGPLTDEEMLPLVRSLMCCTPSGVRGRRSELVEDGVVIDTGARGRTKAGCQCIIWGLQDGQK